MQIIYNDAHSILANDHARFLADPDTAYASQRVHDVYVVCAPQGYEQSAVGDCALGSWGIALFEYLLQVTANCVGFTVMSLPQLKIMQEVIALAVFVPFAVLYMKVDLKWDFLWAALCLVGAVYFMFRSAQ